MAIFQMADGKYYNSSTGQSGDSYTSVGGATGGTYQSGILGEAKTQAGPPTPPNTPLGTNMFDLASGFGESNYASAGTDQYGVPIITGTSGNITGLRDGFSNADEALKYGAPTDYVNYNGTYVPASGKSATDMVRDYYGLSPDQIKSEKDAQAMGRAIWNPLPEYGNRAWQTITVGGQKYYIHPDASLTGGQGSSPAGVINAAGNYKTDPVTISKLFSQYLGYEPSAEEISKYTGMSQPELTSLLSNTSVANKQGIVGDAQGAIKGLNAPSYNLPDYSSITGSFGNAPTYQAPDYSGVMNAFSGNAPTYQAPDYSGAISGLQANAPTYNPVDASAYQAQAPQFNEPNYQQILSQYGVDAAQAAYNKDLQDYQAAQTQGMMLEQTATDSLKDSSWALGLSYQDLDARISDPNSPTYIENPFTRDKILSQAESAKKATIAGMLDKITAVYKTVLSAKEFASENSAKELDRVTKIAQQAYESVQWLAREQYQQQWSSNRDTADKAFSEAQYGNRQAYDMQADAAKSLFTASIDDAQTASNKNYDTQADMYKTLYGASIDDAQTASNKNYDMQADLYKTTVTNQMKDIQNQSDYQYDSAKTVYENQYDALSDYIKTLNANTGGNAKIETTYKDIIGSDNKLHTYLINDATGETIADLGLAKDSSSSSSPSSMNSSDTDALMLKQGYNYVNTPAQRDELKKQGYTITQMNGRTYAKAPNTTTKELLGADNKMHMYLVDEATGTKIKDLGVSESAKKSSGSSSSSTEAKAAVKEQQRIDDLGIGSVPKDLQKKLLLLSNQKVMTFMNDFNNYVAKSLASNQQPKSMSSYYSTWLSEADSSDEYESPFK